LDRFFLAGQSHKREFGEVRFIQGKIIGQMNALGFSAKEEATLTALRSQHTAATDLVE